MTIRAYTPYPEGCRLEVVWNGKLVKSDILPYEEALENLKKKLEQ